MASRLSIAIPDSPGPIVIINAICNLNLRSHWNDALYWSKDLICLQPLRHHHGTCPGQVTVVELQRHILPCVFSASILWANQLEEGNVRNSPGVSSEVTHLRI